jgi:hypothetical protein
MDMDDMDMDDKDMEDMDKDLDMDTTTYLLLDLWLRRFRTLISELITKY